MPLVEQPVIDCFTNEVSTFVHEQICRDQNLEQGVFPFSEQPLTFSGRPCGTFFCLFGPRQVRYTAIWERRTNSVLFYGSNGQRIGRRVVPELAESKRPDSKLRDVEREVG